MKQSIALGSFVVCVFILTQTLKAQIDGSIDPTFNSDDTGFGHGDGIFNGSYLEIAEMLELPDHSIIAVGGFNSYNGVDRSSVMKLTSSGELDLAFNAGSGTYGSILAAALDGSGRVLIAGEFTSVDNHPYEKLARLNTNGSVDTTFTAVDIQANFGDFSYLVEVTVQTDGRILCGGRFDTVDGFAYRNLVRLFSDGTVDTTFSIGTGFYGYPLAQMVRSILVQPDDRIVVGGDYFMFDGDTTNKIVRLMPNGERDTSFVIGSGLQEIGGCLVGYYGVTAMAFAPAGKIVAVGGFSVANGFARSKIAVLNSDGSVDQSFNPGGGFECDEPMDVDVTASGDILLSSGSTLYNGQTVKHLIRVNPNGSWDNGFQAFNDCTGALIQQNGRILIHTPYYYDIAGLSSGIMRLQSNGHADAGFNVGSGATGPVVDMATASNGKIMVAGQFRHYEGHWVRDVIRINEDGTWDPTFVMLTGYLGSFNSICVQPDDKVLVGGWIFSFNGAPNHGIVRLQADGSVDPTFSDGFAAYGEVNAIALQSTGKILVGGQFGPYAGAARYGLMRLNSDGSLDPSFAITTGMVNTSLLPDSVTPHSVSVIRVLPDDRILVGGWFTSAAGTPAYGLVRLMPDGQVDPTFITGSGFADPLYLPAIPYGYSVRDIEPLTDGRVLISGSFWMYNGVTNGGLIRLLSDGSLDATFDAGSIAGVDILPLPDGNIMVANGPSLYQLTANGGVDPNFDQGSGFYGGFVQCLFAQSGERVIAAGTFTGYDGTGRNRILRLNAADPNLSVENIDVINASLFAYPNPAHDRAQLSHVRSTDHVLIRNITGSLIRDEIYDSHIDLSGLPPAVYSIELPREHQHVLLVKE